MNVSETNEEYITLINLDKSLYSIYNLIFIILSFAYSAYSNTKRR